jgi:hypothetical protein
VGIATVRPKNSKIKGRGTGAASSPCLHKVFISTPFFASGTDFKQLIEQTQFYCVPSATERDEVRSKICANCVDWCTAKLQVAGNCLPRPCVRQLRGTGAVTAVHLSSFNSSLAEHCAADDPAGTRHIPTETIVEIAQQTRY